MGIEASAQLLVSERNFRRGLPTTRNKEGQKVIQEEIWLVSIAERYAALYRHLLD